ncbi:MAG: Uma2 family endonuclease [Gemmataceae bacterium]
MAVAKARKNRRVVADDLETPDGFEVVDGNLVENPSVGTTASRVATRIVGRLYNHCEATGAGEVLQGDTPFDCFARPKRHVRKPDLAFVLAARAATVPDKPGDYPIRPDLVVEVVSPRERVVHHNAKVRDWLSVRVPLIWVIDPENRVSRVYVKGAVSEVGEDDPLPVGTVLRGFVLRPRDVLPPAPPP